MVDEGWLALDSFHRRGPVQCRELGELPQLFPIAGVIGRLGDGYSGLHRWLFYLPNIILKTSTPMIPEGILNKGGFKGLSSAVLRAFHSSGQAATGHVVRVLIARSAGILPGVSIHTDKRRVVNRIVAKL
jgi:hypothetical protein